MSNQKTTSYSLNEVLKERAAREQHQDSQGEKTLDDLSRVKVLSPGRKVFKRFIRNRLAVFGSILLITMFYSVFLLALTQASLMLADIMYAVVDPRVRVN